MRMWGGFFVCMSDRFRPRTLNKLFFNWPILSRWHHADSLLLSCRSLSQFAAPWSCFHSNWKCPIWHQMSSGFWGYLTWEGSNVPKKKNILAELHIKGQKSESITKNCSCFFSCRWTGTWGVFQLPGAGLAVSKVTELGMKCSNQWRVIMEPSEYHQFSLFHSCRGDLGMK